MGNSIHYRFAGNKACMQDVAGKFNFSEAGLFRIMNHVTYFMGSVAPTEIHLQRSQTERRAPAQDFELVSIISLVWVVLDFLNL